MRSTLIGRFLNTIDGKNRLFIPPRFREELAKEGKKHFVLTAGFGDCLWMFLPSDWDRFLIDLGQLKLANKDQERNFKRILFASASEVEVDGQGRILVPQLLKDKARLRKEVSINGAGNKVELWDSATWAAFERKSKPVYRKVSNQIEI